MIFACNIPLFFWGEAVDCATYVLNRNPTSANERRRSPYEVLTKTAPDLRDIVVFGSPCNVRRDPVKNSLLPRSEERKIMGRNDETKRYRVYLPKINIVITTQHVKNVATLPAEQNERLLRCISDAVTRRDNTSAPSP